METGGGSFPTGRHGRARRQRLCRRTTASGQVFSIDPRLRVPEETLYLRYEDTIVVTDTGYGITDFLPMDSTTWSGWSREGRGAEGAAHAGVRIEAMIEPAVAAGRLVEPAAT